MSFKNRGTVGPDFRERDFSNGPKDPHSSREEPPLRLSLRRKSKKTLDEAPSEPQQ